MDIQFLKQKILEDERVMDILQDLGCHHIKRNGNDYITCGNPDGDNTAAITVYLNDNLTCVNYTRSILPNGQIRTADLLDLVMYIKELNFFRAIQWVCNTCGWDYYEEEEELPPSLEWLHFLTKMNKECAVDEDDDDAPLKPIDESILDYYLPVGNYLFEKDGISLSTQQLFEVGYDQQTNRVTIPIRSEIGDLVGIKGRLLSDTVEPGESKYLYLTNCPKGRVLYGLNVNMDDIQRVGRVIVTESEKSVMQLYDMGYYGVATGGSKITKHQITMLTRLGVQIIFAYDQDIEESTLQEIANEFVDGVPVYAIIDKDNILEPKQSPSDDPQKWRQLVRNNIYRIK